MKTTCNATNETRVPTKQHTAPAGTHGHPVCAAVDDHVPPEGKGLLVGGVDLCIAVFAVGHGGRGGQKSSLPPYIPWSGDPVGRLGNYFAGPLLPGRTARDPGTWSLQIPKYPWHHPGHDRHFRTAGTLSRDIAHMPTSQAPLGEKGLTFNRKFDADADIVEVATHTILYVRGVYPPDLFVRRRKWDAPVYQSRHPALNEYIAGAIGAVRDELLLGTVDKVVLVIKSGQDVALERFIFSLSTVVKPGPSEMSRWNKDMVYVRGATRSILTQSSVQDSLPFLALPQHFRAFLVKLSLVEAQLGDLPPDEDMSFGIFIELQDGATPSSTGSDPPPWIAANTQHTSAGTSDDAQLRVIRALDTGVINLALAIQESGEKLGAAGSTAAGKGKRPL
ncbi:Mitotic spindle assembly checkpoint protein MAD2B [Ceratobasidium theobromae]|uniref:Mitotic spindle assembly checkpoint protein MAD2B n=1 Tax=Ceratobasidium theobromae TaxID=1582974 RepID=A0A5N5QBW1_9AGAM|nr:Mitotic spindle assembly checkpoint protein MAD2B [Ceratobasidium theobromae]